MAKPSKKSTEQKLQVVLAVLRGELSAVEAGRKAGVSEQSVHNWKRIFLESGLSSWAKTTKPPRLRHSPRTTKGAIRVR